MVAHNGTTFGGFGRAADADKMSLTVSNEGTILVYKLINIYPEQRFVKTYCHCQFIQFHIFRQGTI